MIQESVNYTESSFRIKTRSLTSYSMNNHHFHDAYEIYYMNSGSRDYFIQDTTYRVGPGNLVLVRPQDLHKTMDTGVSHSRILMSFKEDYLTNIIDQDILERVFSPSRVLTFDLVMQNNVENVLREMIIEADQQDLGYDSRLKGLLAKLLVLLARHLENQLDMPTDDHVSNEKVQEIIKYLKVHYEQAISLDELSEQFFISRYYLTRIFKKTTGFTIFEFIHSLRIVEAKRLLSQTDMKVIEVAQKVGFTNVSNFGKVFKSITGLSPLKYRKENRS